MSYRQSFKPIVNENCRVLILGSMPGEESLRKQQYYANERNQFWDLIFSQWNAGVPSRYEDRCNFLLEKGIAVFDVMKLAVRNGSLDSSITNYIPNDFNEFFKTHPNIRHVFFNGTKAMSAFKKHFKHIMETGSFYLLPSSSPTPGKHIKSLTEKKMVWSKVRDVLTKS